MRESQEGWEGCFGQFLCISVCVYDRGAHKLLNECAYVYVYAWLCVYVIVSVCVCVRLRIYRVCMYGCVSFCVICAIMRLCVFCVGLYVRGGEGCLDVRKRGILKGSALSTILRHSHIRHQDLKTLR